MGSWNRERLKKTAGWLWSIKGEGRSCSSAPAKFTVTGKFLMMVRALRRGKEAERKREMGMKDGREKTRDRDKAPVTRF